MNHPLPAVFAPLHPVNVKFHGTHWTAANCPVCGMRSEKDGDRLMMFVAGMGMNRKTKAVCRVCGNIWWPDDKTPKGTTPYTPSKPDPKRIQKARKEMYTALRRMQYGVHHWNTRGVTKQSVEQMRLRYTVKRFWWKEGEELKSKDIPSLAIPFWSPTGMLLNLQYRLLEIPKGMHGKYRWHAKAETGVPFSLFRTRFGDAPFRRTWLVEGAIKAIVFSQTLDKKELVLGTSQNSINANELSQMPTNTSIIYIPDPDMFSDKHLKKLHENMKNLQATGVRKLIVLRLDEKIDDLIISLMAHSGQYPNHLNGRWQQYAKEYVPLKS